jgi:diaminobutyrate-2-oxoglutarate transaminase
MIWGLDIRRGDLARKVIDTAFEKGLLLESCGSDDEVLKFMPALNIPEQQLRQGLQLFRQSLQTVFLENSGTRSALVPSTGSPIASLGSSMVVS